MQRSIYPNLLFLLALAILTGCAAPLTYADTQATAVVSGCWPDGYPTPRAVTVTPIGMPAPTTMAATNVPGVPTLTPLPTTTAIPRCPPPPGATAIPWPTAVPPPDPYPTIEPRTWIGGSWRQTTLLLPVKVLTVDLAVHPSEGWPAVASVVWSGNEDPDRVMVSVYNPHANQWSHARQVDLGASRIGRYTRTVAVTITGAGEVVAVWGMSDPDFRDGDPPTGIWTASSRDYGQSWSAPQRIATDCRMVNDAAASPEGVVVVQLICDDRPRAASLVIVVRQADGIWQAPEQMSTAVWKYSEGSVVISGRGESAAIVSVTLAGRNGRPTAIIARRPVAGGAWQLHERDVTVGTDMGLRMWNVHGLAYDRLRPDGLVQPAVSITWTGADAQQGVYALTSLDGGLSWGNAEPVFVLGQSGSTLLASAPASDPVADRLVTFFTCCADASWQWAEATHYARWSVPGSGIWRTPGGEDVHQLVPLTLGSRAAAQTVTSQAPGSRMAWIAWIDTLERVEVRSVDLNQIIPVQEYPTPLPPTPTTIGGA